MKLLFFQMLFIHKLMIDRNLCCSTRTYPWKMVWELAKHRFFLHIRCEQWKATAKRGSFCTIRLLRNILPGCHERWWPSTPATRESLFTHERLPSTRRRTKTRAQEKNFGFLSAPRFICTREDEAPRRISAHNTIPERILFEHQPAENAEFPTILVFFF